MSTERVRVPEAIRFADFEFDLRMRELRRAGRPLKLERIPTDLLLMLLENEGQIVSRKQIVERIWGRGIFFDTDNSINGAVRKIRQVLRDHPGQPRFVQTVTGRGYRFIAPLNEPLATPEFLVPVPAAKPQEKAHLALRGGHIALLAMVVAAAVALGSWQWLRRERPSPAGSRRMLAVLPFANLTGDASQEYFSDGLTEEMIAQIGRIDPQHVGVIARTSTMHYKQSKERLGQIGRELGVQYILEGSVRRDAESVRITAQLIAVSDRSRVWARQYDRRLSSLLALQNDISQEVAEEIQLALGDSAHIPTPIVRDQKSPSPSSYEAYDLYLKGRYFWNKRTAPAFQQAVEYFQQAIARDPNYARAYAGLADAYALMSSYHVVPAIEFMPKARAAALRALEIDESLAEAHTSLALISENYDWDWHTAEKEYRRAIQLDPAYATAHQWYAECLGFQGRFDEAFVESEHARLLDPLSLIIAADNGALFYFSRQYDRSIQQFHTVLDMDPNFLRAEVMLSAYVQKGDFSDAQARVDQWRRSDSGPLPLAWEAYIYGRSGKLPLARRALARFEQQLRRRSQLDPAPMLAVIYIGMGNKDEAIAWLEKSYSQHSNAVTGLKVDPIYDPLRSDPRFQDLQRRVGLVD